MELFWQFVFAFAAASVGFLVHRIIGFNIYAVISAISLVFVLLPLMTLTLSDQSLTFTEVVSSLNLYLTNFTVFLPSLIIGHVAGAAAGALFGNRGTFSNLQFR